MDRGRSQHYVYLSSRRTSPLRSGDHRYINICAGPTYLSRRHPSKLHLITIVAYLTGTYLYRHVIRRHCILATIDTNWPRLQQLELPTILHLIPILYTRSTIIKSLTQTPTHYLSNLHPHSHTKQMFRPTFILPSFAPFHASSGPLPTT